MDESKKILIVIGMAACLLVLRVFVLSTEMFLAGILVLLAYSGYRICRLQKMIIGRKQK